jgi:hypothetical protein
MRRSGKNAALENMANPIISKQQQVYIFFMRMHGKLSEVDMMHEA